MFWSAAKRLFDIFDKKYTDIFKEAAKDECRRAVKYILERNIIRGDALYAEDGGRQPATDCVFRMVAGQWQHLQAAGFTFHGPPIMRG